MKQLRRLWKIAENNTDIVLTFLVIGVLFFCYAAYTPFIFATNDDLFIKSILSGEITGTPEFRGIHIGVLTGWLISSLYRVVRTIPWYGLFLCICQLSAMAVVLYKCLRMTVKKQVKILIVLLFGLIASGLLLPHFVAVQYTVTTGVVGGTAIFLFCVTDDSQGELAFLKANIPTFIFFLLAYSIRDKATIMLLPIAGMLWIGKLWVSEVPFLRKKVKSYMGFLGIIVLLMGIVTGLEYLSYAEAEWRDFKRYNDNRERIYDYYGYPDYETNQMTYEELGISYVSYRGASTGYSLLLDNNINADAMQVLADVAEQAAEGKVFFGDKLKNAVVEFVNRNLAYTDRPTNFYVYLAYFSVIVLTLMLKKYRVLLPIGAVFFGRMVTWGYLFWQGRYPVRVTQALYLAEFMVLLAVALKYKLFSVKKKAILFIITSMFICLTIRFGFREISECRSNSQRRIAESTAYEQWKEYSEAHTEAIYIMDMHSVEYYTENILATQEYPYHNFVTLGGWLPKSPLYEEKIQNIEIEDIEKALLENKEVYAVYTDNEGVSVQYLYDYYEEKYPGYSWEIIDTYTTDNGTNFVIIKPVQMSAEVK